jgi:hypothetical protein
MPDLDSSGPILIRTNFARPLQWEGLRAVLLRSGPGGVRPEVTVVDDPCWEDATHDEIVTAAAEAAHPLIVVADERALDVAGLRPMVLRPRRERVPAQPLWKLLAG